MNKRKWIFILSVFAFFAWGCTSECKCDCEKDDDFIIIDTQDTALIKNARIVVIEGEQEVYFAGKDQLRVRRVNGKIIIDTQDTARIVVDSSISQEELDSLLDRIRNRVPLKLKKK